jgi:CRP-like cAMP-binding protein
LTPLQITEIARRADRIVFKPGDVIFGAEKIDAAVLIVSGEAVRMSESGMAQSDQSVPAGALVGEMTMLVEPEEPTSIFIARTLVRAHRISRAEMLAQMADDPALADHFVAKISGRLLSFIDELRQIDRSLAGDEAPAAPSAATSDSASPPA